MTPGVRSFVVGFLMGVVACVGFITYYGELGGDWLIGVGQKIRTVARADLDGSYARRDRPYGATEQASYR
jgi:hypothetical protein